MSGHDSAAASHEKPRGYADPTIFECLGEWSRCMPDEPAFCTYDSNGRPSTRHTYSDLARAVASASGQLQQHLKQSQTAILHLPSGFEFAAWFLAGLHAGICISPVHPAATSHELKLSAQRTGASAIIGSNPLPPLCHLTLEGRRSAALDPDLACKRSITGSVLLQSSGTSGSTKLVRRTETSLDADARGVARGMGLERHDGLLLVVPMSHSYGVDLLVAVVLAGATMHVMNGFELAHVHSLLTSGSITVFPGVPFMFDALARSPTFRPSADLRLSLSAGSPLPEHIHAGLLSRCGLNVGQLYGATELGTVAIDLPQDPGFDPRSVGTPLPGVSVRILCPDNGGVLLASDSEGEIAVRSPTMLAEYLREPLELADGHFRTGDLGRLDASGRLYVTGRLKHLIDVGGLKVNPAEVERVMCEHPEIADCALVPMPLSATIVRLRLLIVPREGAAFSTDDVRAFARERLSPYKLPRVFEAVSSLPRTATGKLLRHLLVSS